MRTAPVAFTVDGTALSCKGAIARLEQGFRDLPAGSLARVRVGDIPSRIDLHAWVGRHGHRCVDEVRRGSVFELVIVKGEAGALRVPPATISGAPPS